MSRRALLAAAAAVVAAAAAAAVVVALVPGRSAPVSAPARGIGASGTLDRAVLFGDTLGATVDVVVDRRAVEIGSLRPEGVLGNWLVASTTYDRRDSGPLSRIRYHLELRCLAIPCLPPDPIQHGRESVQLRPIQVAYRRVDGGTGSVSVAWPEVEVASRMTPGDMGKLTPIDQPPFHATLTLPATTYRISPTLLLWLLAVLGGLLLAVAGLLAVRFGPREAPAAPAEEPPPALPVREPTPLERALALLERARERGPVPEQRKALENLAGELRRAGARDLAGSATVLAWAERPPHPDETGALAAAVQRRIEAAANGGGGGNGHAQG